jgi:Flp pilus assembly secretin CpaC
MDFKLMKKNSFGKYVALGLATSAILSGCAPQRPTLYRDQQGIEENAKRILERIEEMPNRQLIHRGELQIYENEFTVQNLGDHKVISYNVRNVGIDYMRATLTDLLIPDTNVETISAITETNNLVMRLNQSSDLESKVTSEELKSLVRSLDQKAPQIMVQASIVKVFADYTHDVSSILQAVSIEGQALPFLNINLKGAELRSPERGAFGGEYGIVGEVGSYALRATLNQLESMGFAEDMASPTLVMASGQRAHTSRTQKVPIPRQIIVGGAISQVTEFESVKNYLEVRANARHEGEIYIDLKAGVGTVNPSGPVQIPSITTREAEISGVRLKQGETLVVAGFLDQRNLAIQRGAPPFSRVPLLGKLFTSFDIEERKDMILFIVTPYYLDPSRSSQPPEENPADVQQEMNE